MGLVAIIPSAAKKDEGFMNVCILHNKMVKIVNS